MSEPGSLGDVQYEGKTVTLVNNYGQSTNLRMIVHEITTRNFRHTDDLSTDVDLIIDAPRIVLKGNVIYGGNNNGGGTTGILDNPVSTVGTTVVRLAVGSNNSQQISGIEFGYGPLNAFTGNQPFGSMYFNAGTGQFQFKSNKDMIGKYAPIKAKEFVLQATNDSNQLDPDVDFTIRSRNGAMEFVHSVDGVFMVFKPPGTATGNQLGTGTTGTAGGGGTGSSDTLQGGALNNATLIMTRPTQFNQSLVAGSTSVFNGPVSFNGGPVEILGQPFVVSSALTTFSGPVQFTGILDARDATVLLPPQTENSWGTTMYYLGTSGAPIVTPYHPKKTLVLHDTVSRPNGDLDDSDSTLAGAGWVINGKTSHYMVYSPTEEVFKLSDSLSLPNDGMIKVEERTVLSQQRLCVGSFDRPGELLLGGGEIGTWRITCPRPGELSFDYRTQKGDWISQTTMQVAEMERVAQRDHQPSFMAVLAPLVVDVASHTWNPTGSTTESAVADKTTTGTMDSILQLSTDPCSLMGQWISGTASVNGTIPGPVVILEPGDTWTFRVCNDLDQWGGMPSSTMKSFWFSHVPSTSLSSLSGSSSDIDDVRVHPRLPKGTMNWYGHGIRTTTFSGYGNSVTRPIPLTSSAVFQWTIPTCHYGGLYWCHPNVYDQSSFFVSRGLHQMVMINGPYQHRLIDSSIERQLWNVHWTNIKHHLLSGPQVTWIPSSAPDSFHPECVETFVTSSSQSTYYLSSPPLTITAYTFRVWVNGQRRIDFQYDPVTRSLAVIGSLPDGGQLRVVYLRSTWTTQELTTSLETGILQMPSDPPRRLRFQSDVDVPVWTPTQALRRSQATTFGAFPTMNGQLLPITELAVNELQIMSLINTTPGTVVTIEVDHHVWIPVGFDGCPLDWSSTDVVLSLSDVQQSSITLAYGQRCEAFLYPISVMSTGQTWKVYGEWRSLSSSFSSSFSFLPIWMGTIRYTNETVLSSSSRHISNWYSLLPRTQSPPSPMVPTDPMDALVSIDRRMGSRYPRTTQFASWMYAGQIVIPLYSFGLLDRTFTIQTDLPVSELPFQLGDTVYVEGDYSSGPAVTVHSVIASSHPAGWIFSFQPVSMSAWSTFQTMTNYLFSIRMEPYTPQTISCTTESIVAVAETSFQVKTTNPHYVEVGQTLTFQSTDPSSDPFSVRVTHVEDSLEFVVECTLGLGGGVTCTFEHIVYDVKPRPVIMAQRRGFISSTHGLYQYLTSQTFQESTVVLQRHVLTRSVSDQTTTSLWYSVWNGSMVEWTMINDHATESWWIHMGGEPIQVVWIQDIETGMYTVPDGLVYRDTICLPPHTRYGIMQPIRTGTAGMLPLHTQGTTQGSLTERMHFIDVLTTQPVYQMSTVDM